jgi:hypothetical protein
MNRRVLLSGFVGVVCLATLWGVWGQRSELAGLRAAQRQLMAQLRAKASGSASGAAAETGGADSGTASPTLAVTPELLRLRSEVTRLIERRRELASVRGENERLRAELASRSTNGAAAYRFPPDYVRKSEARMVGYNTPEDTLQSLLWAIRNRDLTNVLRAYVPESAHFLQTMLQKQGRSIEDEWSDETLAFGMRFVREKTNAQTGTLFVVGEMAPGVSGPCFYLRQTNGEWKITE